MQPEHGSHPVRPDSGFIEVEGGRLFYIVEGAGRPVVFLHGAPGDHSMWNPQVAAFAPGFRVGRYDIRGFGQSRTEPPPAPGSYSRIQDLSSVLERLDFRSTHLVGYSMGSGIAVNFAFKHPDRVERLVLVSSSPPPIPPFPDELDLRTPEGREPLSELRVPTLLLVGERQASAIVFADQVCALTPEAKKVVIPNAGHLVHQEQPEIFNETVQQFLQTGRVKAPK